MKDQISSVIEGYGTENKVLFGKMEGKKKHYKKIQNRVLAVEEKA